MHHADGDSACQLDAEIPVGYAVQAVGTGCGKAQLFGGELTIQRVGGTGQSAGTQRALGIHAGGGILKALQVAQEHGGVGHQRMTKGDGLGALQVGVAGHDSGGILRGLPADDLDELHDVSLQGVAVVPQGQADIQRHLIVAAAAGVQPLARIPDTGGQGLLHKGVHVLGGGVNSQRTAGQVVRDGSQAAEDIRTVLLRDDALPCQHSGMDAAAAHILRDHPLVEADGGVEVVDAAVHRLGKPTLPELFCHNKLLNRKQAAIPRPHQSADADSFPQTGEGVMTRSGMTDEGAISADNIFLIKTAKPPQGKTLLRRCRRQRCRLTFV